MSLTALFTSSGLLTLAILYILDCFLSEEPAGEETEILTGLGHIDDKTLLDPFKLSNSVDTVDTNHPPDEEDEAANDGEEVETLGDVEGFICNVQDIYSLETQPDDTDHKMLFKLNDEST